MNNTRIARWLLIVLLAMAIGIFVYAHNSNNPVLFYYGASPEVPQGAAISIMNPLRDRTSEHTAERLINDLSSAKCEEILLGFETNSKNNRSHICSVLQRAPRFKLIWREDHESSKTLVFNLPDQKARLWIYFSRGDAGFGVYSVSLLQ